MSVNFRNSSPWTVHTWQKCCPEALIDVRGRKAPVLQCSVNSLPAGKHKIIHFTPDAFAPRDDSHVFVSRNLTSNEVSSADSKWVAQLLLHDRVHGCDRHVEGETPILARHHHTSHFLGLFSRPGFHAHCLPQASARSQYRATQINLLWFLFLLLLHRFFKRCCCLPDNILVLVRPRVSLQLFGMLKTNISAVES